MMCEGLESGVDHQFPSTHFATCFDAGMLIIWAVLLDAALAASMNASTPGHGSHIETWKMDH